LAKSGFPFTFIFSACSGRTLTWTSSLLSSLPSSPPSPGFPENTSASADMEQCPLFSSSFFFEGFLFHHCFSPPQGRLSYFTPPLPLAFLRSGSEIFLLPYHKFLDRVLPNFHEPLCDSSVFFAHLFPCIPKVFPIVSSPPTAGVTTCPPFFVRLL